MTNNEINKKAVELLTKEFRSRMPKGIQNEIVEVSSIWNNGFYYQVTLVDGYKVISKSYKEAKRHIQRHLEK